MKKLMLGAALLSGAACGGGGAPQRVYVGSTTAPEGSTTTEAPTTTAPATTTTEPVVEPEPVPTTLYVAPVTTRRTTTTVAYEPPSPQGRTTGRGNEPAGGDAPLACIRSYEGDYGTNTGNGYYGAYQFDLQTWRSVGGTGLPSDASPAEQDMRAQMLYDQRGLSPWPTPNARCR